MEYDNFRNSKNNYSGISDGYSGIKSNLGYENGFHGDYEDCKGCGKSKYAI